MKKLKTIIFKRLNVFFFFLIHSQHVKVFKFAAKDSKNIKYHSKFHII